MAAIAVPSTPPMEVRQEREDVQGERRRARREGEPWPATLPSLPELPSPLPFGLPWRRTQWERNRSSVTATGKVSGYRVWLCCRWNLPKATTVRFSYSSSVTLLRCRWSYRYSILSLIRNYKNSQI
ncbi:uncharacterized protein LOC107643510 isoform X1 [Arachis ipaensis]|uniref:uncharacterized protein LOC107643510 isoform X1 n=1 Tax=Arachis ipaensis TaxID=130454 RepID=UPI0007AFC068|nr:uncharacterized protein LOC107643510 isoform X1 [Arachis ipaensis]XP_025654385.1 uncharacterized protein LOC112750071 isoform X1 [Arachis hypogaea]QHO11605.1 uncharacterized protein DS421_15g499540 [Arachis hypogaea]